MSDSEPVDIVVGGDAKLMRAAGAPVVAGSIEVPCQECGRMTLIAPAGQRVALGEPEELLKLKAGEGGGLAVEPAGVNPSPAPVLCMWCAFADQPEILSKLPKPIDD